ncbi:phage distal tail protein [Streptomyces anulatus]|uniref:phage distal tail protein n=1 Tax=Streptomyces anulatus TaxID=1892 RepID=UPI00342CF440
MAGELITADWQIDWNGFLLGAGSLYDVVRVDGWIDSPGLTNGAAPKPTRRGSWPGPVRAQARTVTATLEIGAGSSMGDAIAALRAATPVSRTGTQAPLAIRTSGQTLVANAVFGGRIVPVDQPYSMGFAQHATVQWWCADPVLLELTPRTVTIIPGTSGSGGLTYPLTYPLDYGTAGAPANATCRNYGNEPTSPVLVFTGPLTTPRVINTTLGYSLEFGLDLLAGQTLTIDTDAGTVLLNGTTDRLYTRSNLSVPVEYFELDPGDNNLQLLAAAFGPGAQLQVTWKSAYL